MGRNSIPFDPRYRFGDYVIFKYAHNSMDFDLRY
jgi:hypothetical protein